MGTTGAGDTHAFCPSHAPGTSLYPPQGQHCLWSSWRVFRPFCLVSQKSGRARAPDVWGEMWAVFGAPAAPCLAAHPFLPFFSSHLPACASWDHLLSKATCPPILVAEVASAEPREGGLSDARFESRERRSHADTWGVSRQIEECGQRPWGGQVCRWAGGQGGRWAGQRVPHTATAPKGNT